MIAFLGLPGGSEWIIILLIALLLFGSRLPSVARSLAQALAGFKHEMNKARDEIASEVNELDKAGEQPRIGAKKPQETKEQNQEKS